jgi:hypothetical protein
VFGLTGLMLVFMVAQGAWVSRYIEDEPGAEPERLAKDAAEVEPERGG